MLIKEIILYTNLLQELKKFYQEVLELRINNDSDTSFTVITNSASLTFCESKEIAHPFYHYAFNIPENLFNEAKLWSSSRVDLIKLNGNDEFDFKSWNAHSFYFYDPGGNIVELIARHSLNNKSDQIFSEKDLLGISEIGFPTGDVKNFYNTLNKKFNIPFFSGDMETFIAAGDDNGLFIIVKEGRNWFPDCPEAKIFPLAVKIISDTKVELNFHELPYKIISI